MAFPSASRMDLADIVIDEERKMEWMERERKSKSKRVCQKVKKQRRW